MIECAAAVSQPGLPAMLIFFIVALAFTFHMVTRPPKSEQIVAAFPAEEKSEEPVADFEEDISPQFAKRNPELTKRLQETARSLGAHGDVITTDDVWALCPIPDGINPKVMGQAFMPRIIWRKMGYRPSARPECNKRPVTMWQLKEGARPQWVSSNMQALDCDGSDPIADAERTWPNG